MLFKLLQLEKVPTRTVTDEGILILESALHPLKVYGNFVKLDDNVTSFKFVQFSKQLYPNSSTEFGISILFSNAQPKKQSDSSFLRNLE